MRNLIIYLSVFLCTFFTSHLFGQESFESRAKAIAISIEKITKEEKDALKLLVEAVNADLDKGVITSKEADDKKIQLAQASATKIEERVAIEEEKLTNLVKDKVEGNIKDVDTTGRNVLSISLFQKKNKRVVFKSRDKRTTSQLVFAAGINNLATDGAVAHSDFRYMGSHFYELGYTHNTRILKEQNLLHIKYGLSLQFNNLRATDNRYFQEQDNQTNLQTSNLNLKDSRFNNVNLVVPMHFEFDFSDAKIKDGKTFFRTHESLRVGLGGFIGVNIKSKQTLIYDDIYGNEVTQKAKGNFNVNDLVYGLSGYIGYRATSLYVKYDLNPVFKNNVIDQKNISLGLRFDLN